MERRGRQNDIECDRNLKLISDTSYSNIFRRRHVYEANFTSNVCAPVLAVYSNSVNSG